MQKGMGNRVVKTVKEMIEIEGWSSMTTKVDTTLWHNHHVFLFLFSIL